MLFSKFKFAIPVKFVWIVLFIVLLPDMLRLAGMDFGSYSWEWKSFTYLSLEFASVVTAILIVIISFVDFRIKGDVSTPLVASTMLFSGALDFMHLMAVEGLILDSGQLLFNSVYTWTFSRTFNAFMLLFGTGLFLIQSDNLFKNVRLHNRKFLIYVLSLFTIITIACITLVAGLDNNIIEQIRPFVYSRQLDVLPLFLYLISLTLIFPKFYSNHPSIFSQTLLLSLIPSVSAQLHVVFGTAAPYDHNTIVASYEKLISYLVPFAGIALNYLQTHYNELRAIRGYRAEVNKKNQVNSLLEGIMDVSLSGILVFESVYDMNGNIRDFRCIKHNNAAAGLSGASIFQGQNFTQIFTKERELFDNYVKLVQDNSPFDRELFCELSGKWLLLSNVKYRNGFVMTIIDISESKQAEQQLRKREELLSGAEKAASFGSFEFDLITGEITLSENMSRMLELPSKQYQGQRESLRERFGDIEMEKSSRLLEVAIRDHTPYYNEYSLGMSNGSIAHFITSAKIIYDEKGVALKAVGVTMDVTDRVKATGQMRRNELLYRTFASNMPDTEVILYDENYHIILIEGNSGNPLFNLKSELLNKDVRTVLKRFEIDIEGEVLSDEDSHIATIETDGRHFRVHHSLVQGENKGSDFSMLLFQDITEIKKSELLLEARLQELDRSNKELENFAYVASHDLQEPLRKITAFGDRLKVKYQQLLPVEGAEYLRRMTEATQRMQRLISDLLAFSRITRMSEPFMQVSLDEVIRDILSDIDMKVQTTGARISISGLTEIEGIPSQLHQLFQNLILNAIKFSIPDTSPEIHIQGEILTARALGGRGTRKYIRISVKDKGIGFEQKYADRIFTLFQRLHGRHEYEGTGIGLALCRKIAEHHDGTIEAFSKENEGAEFIIILPLTQVKKVRTPEPKESSQYH